jgi:hypothetical protein
MSRKGYYRVYGSTLLGLTALTAFLQFAGGDFTDAAISEGGPIESLSALGYFMGVILLGFIRKPSSYPYLIVILVLMGFRELDFHNRFTTLSLSKITFYVSPEVSLLEKMLGVILIMLILYVLVRLAGAHFSDFITALKRKEPPALGVCLGIGLIVFTKTLDGLARKLASVGMTMSNHLEQLTIITEEVFELGIPLMFIIAIIAYSRTT